LQGDFLSQLLFFLELVPLTNMLNKQGAVYEVKGSNRISHLFFMDDLKLFSRNKTELQQELTIAKAFRNCIRMEFGLEQSATTIYKHDK
jgi:hypothetical protein